MLQAAQSSNSRPALLSRWMGARGYGRWWWLVLVGGVVQCSMHRESDSDSAGGAKNGQQTHALTSPSAPTSSDPSVGLVPRLLHTATVLDDDRIVLVGGQRVKATTRADAPIDSVEVYDPTTPALLWNGRLATARVLHATVRLADHRLLVIGGRDGQQSLASIELIDLRGPLPTIRTVGTLAEAREAHTATRFITTDGQEHVLVVGGVQGTSVLATTEILDIDPTGTGPEVSVRVGPRLQSARRYHSATQLGSTGREHILVAGGLDPAGRSLASAEVYDPVSTQWSTIAAPLRCARAFHQATRLGSGDVLLTGGFNNNQVIACAELYDGVGGQFTSLPSAQPLQARLLHSATLLADGSVLLAGGVPMNLGNTDGTDSLERFDPATLRFTSFGRLQVARERHTATRLASGAVLFIGGQNMAQIEIDPVVERYIDVSGGTDGGAAPPGDAAMPTDLGANAPGGDLSVPPPASLVSGRLLHTVTPLRDGSYLIVGGTGTRRARAPDPVTSGRTDAELYVPGRSTTERLPFPLNEGHALHTATRLPDGRVLVLGGVGSGGRTIATGEIYYPDTGRFYARSSGAARQAHTATLLGNADVFSTDPVSVWVAGGASNGAILGTSELYRYDPASGTINVTSGPNLVTARQLHSAVRLQDGRVALIGGLAGQALGSIELFDPQGSGSVRLARCSLHTPRFFHRTTLLADGRVLITGGNSSLGGSAPALREAELFDPLSETCSVIAIPPDSPLPAARELHIAELTSNGYVLLAGGLGTHDGQSVLDSAEWYDPVRQIFVPATSLGTPRWAMAYGVLPSGDLWIAGGQGGPGLTSVLDSAEVYLLCGLPGRVCCGGDRCVGNQTCDDGLCMQCGDLQELCCADQRCNGVLVCDGTVCQADCDDDNACTMDGLDATQGGRVCLHVPLSAGTTCRAAVGGCDIAETCDGTGTPCPTDARVGPGGVCRVATGPCDVAEMCDGTGLECPPDQLAAVGTVCRAAVQGGCDIADVCDGASVACPADGYTAEGTVCRAARGVCDFPETCTGTGPLCPPDQLFPPSVICRAAVGSCDRTEYCDGRGIDCPGDALMSAGTVCRGPRDVNYPECDPQEVCTGSNALCPPDVLSSVQCRAGTHVLCDVAEFCANGTCPADVVAANGTPCTDNDACTISDTCQGGRCQSGPAVTCAPPQNSCLQAGVCNPATGICDYAMLADGAGCSDGNSCTSGDVCQGGSCRGVGVTCGPPGPCEEAGACNPVNGLCAYIRLADGTPCITSQYEGRCTQGSCQPVDCNDLNPCTVDRLVNGECEHAVAPAGTLCRAARGVCDVAEVCDGTSINCPPNAQRPAGTQCRARAGFCDVAEVCDGVGDACPVDVFAPNTVECRPAAGVCDVAERCTGQSTACPADQLQPSSVICRPSAGSCDVTETCTGQSAVCPGDVFMGAGTVCRAPRDVNYPQCDPAEVCDGGSALCPADVLANVVCRPAGGDAACDPAELCSNGTCPGNVLASAGTSCSDDNACTSGDVCNGNGGCVGGSPVVCQAPNGCQVAGCHPSTGCYTTNAANGTSCSDGNACTVGDSCQNGVCQAGSPVSCTSSDPCAVPSCNPVTGQCMFSPAPAGILCRSATGACDVAEVCNGTSTSCPPDGFRPSGYECRASGGPCDVAEVCSGTSASCSGDGKRASGTVCGTGNGASCIQDYVCDGATNGCTQARPSPAGTVCRGASDVCDVAEVCNGTVASCPADGVLAAGTPCRAAARQCDAAEVCTGGSKACPADGNVGNGTACNDGNGCTSGDQCVNGVCQSGSPVTCAAVACQVGTCNPATGSCSYSWLANGTSCTRSGGLPGLCQNGVCQGECSPGQTRDVGACGNCGRLIQTCTAQGQWDAGSCQGQGVCSPGSTRTGASCQCGGNATDTCSSSCQWQAGSCPGGACCPGQTRDVGACGNCGRLIQTCGSNYQWDGGVCQGQGVCAPGSTRQGASCQCGGTATDTCSASCQWQAGTCPSGVCIPGQTRTVSCGCGGSQTDTCSSSCQWTAGSCQGGTCAQGETCCGYCANLVNDVENCGGCGRRCQGPCPECRRGTCYDPTQGGQYDCP
jgi:hypothetical protein